MTAPICGARTWTTPSNHVTCDREPGHDKRHVGDCSDGRHAWSDPVCRLVVVTGGASPIEYVLSEQATRDIIASLQRQLDALDPDGVIAAAERRMVEAWRHHKSLREMSRETTEASASADGTSAASAASFQIWVTARKTWQALVEARAKGGGA